MNRVHKEVLLDNDEKKISQFIFTPEGGNPSLEKILEFTQHVQKYAESTQNAFQAFADVTSPYNMIVIEEKE